MLGFGLSIEPQLWALIFVMIRVGSALIAAPVFGAVQVPLPVRVTLSGAIGVLPRVNVVDAAIWLPISLVGLGEYGRDLLVPWGKSRRHGPDH